VKLPWHKIWFTWLVATVLSFGIVAASIAWGKAGDCHPGEVDGQCGLSTFLGLVYGIAGVLMILMGALLRTFFIMYERKRIRPKTEADGASV